MRQFGILLFALFSALPLQAAVPPVELSGERVISFEYKTEIPAVKKGEGPVEFFLPLASSDANQEILERDVESSVKGKIRTEKKYGNSFWQVSLPDTNGKAIPVTVRYKVKRKLFEGPTMESAKPSAKELRKYLRANRLVPVSGELIEKIRKDIPDTGSEPIKKARAIYDFVVDTMEYKKIGKGWGNGDTFWACSEKYGNCTDFHALFISLARAEGIPARFEIGFPIPEAKSSGEVKGYQCWVTFMLEGKGWMPVDAAEAKRQPEKRDLLFGTHPTDRIQFSRGRDIELGKGHKTEPLNYFIYPHVEVAGKSVDEVSTEFSFEILS